MSAEEIIEMSCTPCAHKNSWISWRIVQLSFEMIVSIVFLQQAAKATKWGALRLLEQSSQKQIRIPKYPKSIWKLFMEPIIPPSCRRIILQWRMTWKNAYWSSTKSQMTSLSCRYLQLIQKVESARRQHRQARLQMTMKICLQKRAQEIIARRKMS